MGFSSSGLVEIDGNGMKIFYSDRGYQGGVAVMADTAEEAFEKIKEQDPWWVSNMTPANLQVAGPGEVVKFLGDQ